MHEKFEMKKKHFSQTNKDTHPEVDSTYTTCDMNKEAATTAATKVILKDP